MKTTDDVIQWLCDSGFERFAAQFRANEIDAEVLPDLDISDLASMQIPIGPAKKILKAIQALAETTAAPDPGNVSSNAPAPFTADSLPNIEPERRQLTIMFCDMVGSTALAAQYDPEDLSTIVLSFLECCSGAAQKYNGHVARYMGDGLLIYFGYPRARENDTERAIRAALEMLRDIASLRPMGTLTVSARIGIATGVVVGGESIGDHDAKESVVMGDTPNLAARLQELAKPDTIMVSARTKKLAGNLYKYRSAGNHTLKGFDKPVQAFQVIGEQQFDSRFNNAHVSRLLPMVGREHELALVLERYAQSCNGDGQVVVITAEAGLGKSRIARAAVDNLPHDNQHVISLQCIPYYEQSALYPIEQYLTHYAAITATDDADTCYRKLRQMLERSGESDITNIGIVAQMMALGEQQHPDVYAMPAQNRRSRLLEVLSQFFLRLSETQPVFILIEDIHWIDPTTRSLIELTIESIERRQVIILATERQSDNGQCFNSPITSRLVLNRLGRAQVKEMIEAIAGDYLLGNEVICEIASKTDGVPLYIEELTKAAIESGQLNNSGNGELQTSMNKLSIPSSLQDSLMERLDRLSVVKEYAQVSSVLGRDFEHRLLAATLDRPDSEIIPSLQQLVEAGLLSCIGAPPDAKYSFKHSLIRDAAYESMLKRRRQHWHSRVAVALEKHFPAIVEGEPEILAQHYESCGFSEKALEYWARASDLSLAQFNLHEAIDKTSKGLQQSVLAEDNAANRKLTLKLQLVRALALRSLHGFTDADSATAFETALDLAHSLNDRDRYVAAARGLCVSRYLRGMLPAARTLAEKIVAESTQARHIVDSNLTLGQILYYSGRPAESRKHLNIALKKVAVLVSGTELSRQFDEQCAIEQFRCVTMDLTGEPDLSLEYASKACQRAQELAQPLAIAGTLCHLCLLKLRLRLPCEKEAAQLLEHTVTYQMPFWQAWANYCVAMAGQSSTVEAWQAVVAAREDLQARGVKLGLSNIMVAEAELLLHNNQPQEALSRIAAVKHYIEETSEKYYESEVYRIEGLIHLHNRHNTNAVECFEQSLALAEEQQAFWWQLRSATELAAATSRSEPLASLLESYTGSSFTDTERAVSVLNKIQTTADTPGS